MIVIKRKRNQRTFARYQGSELIVNVCWVREYHVGLGFIGPHEILREELVDQSPKTITHLAGPPIVVGDYRIQRCMMCGVILDEVRSDYPLAPPVGFQSAKFEPGRYYEFRGSGTIVPQPLANQYTFASDVNLPRTCCLIGSKP